MSATDQGVFVISDPSDQDVFVYWWSQWWKRADAAHDDPTIVDNDSLAGIQHAFKRVDDGLKRGFIGVYKDNSATSLSSWPPPSTSDYDLYTIEFCFDNGQDYVQGHPVLSCFYNNYFPTFEDATPDVR